MQTSVCWYSCESMKFWANDQNVNIYTTQLNNSMSTRDEWWVATAHDQTRSLDTRPVWSVREDNSWLAATHREKGRRLILWLTIQSSCPRTVAVAVEEIWPKCHTDGACDVYTGSSRVKISQKVLGGLLFFTHTVYVVCVCVCMWSVRKLMRKSCKNCFLKVCRNIFKIFDIFWLYMNYAIIIQW